MTTSVATSDPEQIATGDFNGDGYLDAMIAGSGGCDQPALLINNRDGTFAATTIGPGDGDNSGELTVGDFDRDGLSDVAMSTNRHPDGNAGIRVYRGKADGTLSGPWIYDLGPTGGLMGGAVSWVAGAADLTGDGILDLLVGWATVEPVTCTSSRASATARSAISER